MTLAAAKVSHQVPQTYDAGSFSNMFRVIESMLGAIAEGRSAGRYQAQSSVPTTGKYVQDDIVFKSGMVEAGAVGNKYVILGWVCTSSGTPGTWKEMRVLTGN
jgi:hypothetical protein